MTYQKQQVWLCKYGWKYEVVNVFKDGKILIHSYPGNHDFEVETEGAEKYLHKLLSEVEIKAMAGKVFCNSERGMSGTNAISSLGTGV